VQNTHIVDKINPILLEIVGSFLAMGCQYSQTITKIHNDTTKN